MNVKKLERALLSYEKRLRAQERVRRLLGVKQVGSDPRFHGAQEAARLN